MQHDLIAGLARNARQQVQVAGGFRNRDQIARMLDAGVARIVIGSLAANDPETTSAAASTSSGRTGSRWRSTSA